MPPDSVRDYADTILSWLSGSTPAQAATSTSGFNDDVVAKYSQPSVDTSAPSPTPAPAPATPKSFSGFNDDVVAKYARPPADTTPVESKNTPALEKLPPTTPAQPYSPTFSDRLDDLASTAQPLVHGVLQPLTGGAQLLAHGVDALTSRIAPDSDTAKKVHEYVQTADAKLAQNEADYQRTVPSGVVSSLAETAGQSAPYLMFPYATVEGQVARALPTFRELVASGVKPADALAKLSLPGRAITGAGTGAAAGATGGALEPVLNTDDYARTKAEQVAAGGLGGAFAGAGAPMLFGLLGSLAGAGKAAFSPRMATQEAGKTVAGALSQDLAVDNAARDVRNVGVPGEPMGVPPDVHFTDKPDTGQGPFTMSAAPPGGGGTPPPAGGTVPPAGAATPPPAASGAPRRMQPGDAASNYFGDTARTVDDVIANLRNAPQLVPGSQPTAADVAQSPTIAKLQKAVSTKADMGIPLAERGEANNAARLNAMRSLTLTEPDANGVSQDFATTARAERDAVVDPLYRQADNSIINTKDVTIGSGADAQTISLPDLLDRPSGRSALKYANKILQEQGRAPIDPDAIPPMLDGVQAHAIKKGFDSVMYDPQRELTPELRIPMQQTLSDYQTWLAQKLPVYAQAKDLYAARSPAINGAELAQNLLDEVLGSAQNTTEPAVTYNKFRSQRNKLENQQKFEIDDHTRSVLDAVEQDLHRATRANAVRSAGSDSAANFDADRWLGEMTGISGIFGRSGAMGGMAGGLGAGFTHGNPVFSAGAGLLGALGSAARDVGEARIRREVARLMLNPGELASALEAARGGGGAGGGATSFVPQTNEVAKAQAGLLGMLVNRVIAQSKSAVPIAGSHGLLNALMNQNNPNQ